MPDTKTTNLTLKATPVQTDEIPINDVAGGNADKKIKVGGIWDAISGDVTGDADGITTFKTSPAFTTPLLGTPTSGNLVNCTGYNNSGFQQNYIRTGGVSYYGSATSISVSSTIALVTDTLRAYPFIVRKSFAIDRIQYEVTTAVAGNGICGIYNSKTDGTLYPDALLVAGTSQSIGTTGIKTDTISATLLADTLYWLAITSSSAATLRSVGTNTAIPTVLGNNGTAAATQWNTGWTVARTYDATMPATFTAAGTVGITSVPLILVRAI